MQSQVLQLEYWFSAIQAITLYSREQSAMNNKLCDHNDFLKVTCDQVRCTVVTINGKITTEKRESYVSFQRMETFLIHN